MKKSLLALTLAGGLMASGSLLAQEISLSVTNVTNASYFTPLLIAAHGRITDLFEPGVAASANLQAMAEGGNISGLIDDVIAAGGDYVADPAGGLLAPGATAEALIDLPRHRNRHLSVVGMLLPTNDGFVGLDSLKIPRHRGTHTGAFLRGPSFGSVECRICARSLPAIPSTMQWWILLITAKRPPSRPSTTQASHSGFEWSRGCAMIRAESFLSCSSLPGRGRLVWRTW